MKQDQVVKVITKQESAEIIRGALIERLAQAVSCLERIADADYRGNRSPEQTDAFNTLKEMGFRE